MSFHKACFLRNSDLAGIAILNRSIVAPRKMQFVADLIRDKSVSFAFSILSCNEKKCFGLFEKLLSAAVSNFEMECEKRNEKFYSLDDVYVSMVSVGSAGMLKRTLPAPQGRAMIVRKRLSNLVIIVRPLARAAKKSKGSVGADVNNGVSKLEKSGVKKNVLGNVKKVSKSKKLEDGAEG